MNQLQNCLKAMGKTFHPECFVCAYCGKIFANSPFYLEDGLPYCEEGKCQMSYSYSLTLKTDEGENFRRICIDVEHILRHIYSAQWNVFQGFLSL